MSARGLALRIQFQGALALLLSLSFLRAAHAVELEGQIRGRIVEAATDLPVPGARVVVSSPGLGEPRTATSDEQGEYLVPNLPVGRYRVTVSYPGVKPMVREVAVDPGVTSPLDIKWSAELAETETTTVIEERPLTNPDSTQTGAVIGIDQERFVPTQRTYQDVVRQAPGVLRNNDINSSEFYIKGGREDYNRYLIDGLEITDPVARQARQRLPFDSVKTVQVLTGGFDAEYNAFGGIINTITREGSDEWHGSVSAYGTNASLDNRRPEGLLPSERDRIFNDDPVAPTYSYIATASLGGPIVEHRFWFNATFEYRFTQSGKLIGPPLNLPLVPQTNETYLPRLKLTWAPSSKHRLGVSLAADPQINNNTNSSSASNNRLGTYQTASRAGGYNAILSWSYFPTSSFEFQLSGGIKSQDDNTGAQGYYGSVSTRFCEQFSPRTCTFDPEGPTHVNQQDNTVWYGADSDYQLRTRTSIQIDPKITWRARWLGEHTAKIGLQLRFLRDREYQHQTGDAKYVDNQSRTAGPNEEGLCLPDEGKTAGCFQRNHSDDRRFIILGYNPAIFLQDHWRPLSWLTLTPGIRFEYGNSRINDGTIFHSQFAVGPRLGLIAELTSDKKTILSTHYGRSNQVGEIGYAANYAEVTQGAKRQDEWRVDRFVTVSSVGGEGGGIIDRKAKVPHQDAITTSLRRQIAQNTVVGVEHTWKRTSNTWNIVESNEIWDPTGYRVIGYLDTVKPPREVWLYTTPSTDIRNYHGITLSLEGRPTPNWYFLAFYTLSWNYGTANTGGIADINSTLVNLHRVPQQFKFNNGFLPQDQRHQLNVAGSYSFRGLTVGVNLEFLSGRPLEKNFYNLGVPTTNKTINHRSPRGTDPGTCSGNVPGQASYTPSTTTCGNDVGRIVDWRTPPRAQVDVLLAYDFSLLLRQHISLTYEIFNILNDRSATSLEESDATSGNFGQVTGRNTGLNMRFGARYDF